MRTYPGVQIGVFKDPEEREQIKVLDNMLRHVSAALAKSIFPGQLPAANPTPVPPNPGGGTTLPTPVRGDLLFSAGGGTWSRLSIGPANSLMQSNGLEPIWTLTPALLTNYLYLPGKATTQTLLQLTTETPFTIRSSVASTNPATGAGTYLFRGISLDSVEVFSFGVDGATTINVPSTTYSTNPIALTLQMLDNVTSGATFFRIRTGTTPTTDVFSVTYHGGTTIDMTADNVALSVDAIAGATSPIAVWSKGGLTQSFIDQNGAWNGAIIGGYAATFHDHLLTIVDGASPTRVLGFNLNSHTAGQTLTLDYRSLVSRSLIWNLSGGTGGNLQLNWGGTAGSTVTFPTATTYTLAGTNITTLQTWTGPHLFTGGSSGYSVRIEPATDGVGALYIKQPTFGSASNIITVNDSADQDVLRINDPTAGADPSLETIRIAVWPSGIGAGFRGTFLPLTLTANRDWAFPNVSGTVILASNSINRTGESGNISQTISASPPTAVYQFLIYAVCTTGSGTPGDGCIINMQWNDGTGLKNVVVNTLGLVTAGTYVSQSLVGRRESGAISFSVTNTINSGAGRYSIFVRTNFAA